jgi:hypothetical protein
MPNLSSIDFDRNAAVQTCSSWIDRRSEVRIIVVVAVLVTAAAALARSFFDGRLADPLTHNDVNYFILGIQHLMLWRVHGFRALISAFLHTSQHAPIATYQAMLSFLLLGIHDWSPYVSNII